MTNAVNLASAAGTGFFRNRLINPWFRVAQRGTTGASGYCSVDRWFGLNTTSFNQVADGPSGLFTRCLEFGNTNATNPVAQQRMEAVNVFDLIGQQVTVSFWAYSVSGSNMTLSVDLVCASALDDHTSQVLIETKSITLTSSWTYYTLTFAALPANTANGIALRFYRVSPCSTRITGVQLEAGATATTFERRQYGQELALCQRYYYTASAYASLAALSGGVSTSIKYPVTMRASPTFSGSVNSQNGNAAGWPQFTGVDANGGYFLMNPSGSNTTIWANVTVTANAEL